jgi:Protein of unknown function (DUF2946)
MDDIVKAALAKWPKVPHCWGWLALDARGQWFMRDDRIQAAGPFPKVKGSRIDHEKLLAFIHRNYESDADGCWFFQNGPQRVYVELEITPWIWRVDERGTLSTHTDVGAGTPRKVMLDEQGRLFAATELGVGIVHTQDMHLAADFVERGTWVPEAVDAARLPESFGYVLSPQKHKGVAGSPAY